MRCTSTTSNRGRRAERKTWETFRQPAHGVTRNIIETEIHDGRKMQIAEWFSFWAKVEKGPSCWLWTGGTNGKYGHLARRVPVRKDFLAHRLIYETCIGPIPEGFEIDHECNNKLCVNPLHLRLLTHAENMARLTTGVCRRGHIAHILPNGKQKCRTCHAMRARNFRKKHHSDRELRWSGKN